MAGASTSMATSLFVRAVGRGVDAGALLSDRHLVRADGAPESDDFPRDRESHTTTHMSYPLDQDRVV
jgi:hypothetical protein